MWMYGNTARGILLGLTLASVFFFPFWIQAFLMGVILFVVRPAAVVLIPALLADLLYSGSKSFWRHFSVTAVVSVALILYWVLKTRTRLFHVYSFLEKKN